MTHLRLAERAGGLLGGTVPAIGKTSSLVHEIADASQEQFSVAPDTPDPPSELP